MITLTQVQVYYGVVRFFDKALRGLQLRDDQFVSLFQTEAWQKSWWDIWGDTPGFQLLSDGGSGSSGLYLDCYYLRKLLPIRCLQFVGTNYRRLSTPRTEYNGFGTVRSLASLFDGLDQSNWSEAVFRDMRLNSDDFRALQALARERGWLVRTVASDDAYSISASGGFDDYLSSLGANTRLKFYNRRKLLQAEGHIELDNFWPSQSEAFFALLNRFHSHRWGRPCFSNDSLCFHGQFLSRIEKEGGVPELSVLTCNHKAISVLYNVVFQGVTYNIQSGFDEFFHRKIALGTLHLGYSVEKAFDDPGVHTFDMLAGGGKNENYKERLATRKDPLISVMVVRSRLLKRLYLLKG